MRAKHELGNCGEIELHKEPRGGAGVESELPSKVVLRFGSVVKRDAVTGVETRRSRSETGCSRRAGNMRASSVGRKNVWKGSSNSSCDTSKCERVSVLKGYVIRPEHNLPTTRKRRSASSFILELCLGHIYCPLFTTMTDM